MVIKDELINLRSGSRHVKMFHPEELIVYPNVMMEIHHELTICCPFYSSLETISDKTSDFQMIYFDHKKSNCPCQSQFHHKLCPWLKNAATPQQQHCLATEQHPFVWKSPRTVLREEPPTLRKSDCRLIIISKGIPLSCACMGKNEKSSFCLCIKHHLHMFLKYFQFYPYMLY